MTDTPAPAPAGKRRIKIWDVPTRVVHWLLAIAFGVAWWTAEVSKADAHMEWHRWAGYSILGLVVFRIYWGLVGSQTARFSHFLKGPVTTGRYFAGLLRRDSKVSLGHNPMGGWSVAAMLALIGAIVVLGLYAIDVDGFEGGPLADRISFDLAREMAHWHHLLFNVALGLIALHLVAIAFYLLVKRENLVGAMITGAKPNPDGEGAPKFAPFWRLAVGVVVSFGIMWFVSKGLKF